MRGLVALGAVAVLLAGCSSDPVPPATLPPLASSPAPSPTPVPTPTGINAPDAFGASAFTKHFFEQLNTAFATLDTSLLKEISDPECKACTGFVTAIDRVREAGNTFRTTTFAVDFAEASPPEATGALVDLRYDVSASVVVDRMGRQVSSEPARPRQVAQAALVRSGAGWRMRALREVTS